MDMTSLYIVVICVFMYAGYLLYVEEDLLEKSVPLERAIDKLWSNEDYTIFGHILIGVPTLTLVILLGLLLLGSMFIKLAMHAILITLYMGKFIYGLYGLLIFKDYLWSVPYHKYGEVIEEERSTTYYGTSNYLLFIFYPKHNDDYYENLADKFNNERTDGCKVTLVHSNDYCFTYVYCNTGGNNITSIVKTALSNEVEEISVIYHRLEL